MRANVPNTKRMWVIPGNFKPIKIRARIAFVSIVLIQKMSNIK